MSTLRYKTARVGYSQRNTDATVNGVRVNEIVDILENLGYSCNIDAEVIGESGFEHRFDIVAEKDSEVIVFDIVSCRASMLDVLSDDEVSEQISLELLRMRAKSLDCRPSLSVVVHLSSYFLGSEESVPSKYDPIQQLSAEFNIRIVRSPDAQGAVKELSRIMTSKEVVAEYGA